ncbi:hypothetical protein K449DRAFT_438447 [Hypoxylon sp. EC38]|nr:hypothetical protein K449DRAFT_438447 [Hypoxylon sp. EC38]
MPPPKDKKLKPKQPKATKARKFRYFTRLPPELQLMIWEFYEDVRLPIRHCFSIDCRSRRVYAAFDARRKRVINTLAKPEDNSFIFLPHTKKIRFTGIIHVEPPSHKEHIFDGEYGLREAVSSPVVYADLKHDIFCFNYCPYHQSFKEWFRFLRNPISHVQPPKLPEDHWIFGVRAIALSVPTADVEGSSWDLQVIRRMSSLKCVYHIAPSHLCNRFSWMDPTYPPLENGTAHSRQSSGFIVYRSLCPEDKHTLRENGYSEHIFRIYGAMARPILAVDRAMKWF